MNVRYLKLFMYLFVFLYSSIAIFYSGDLLILDNFAPEFRTVFNSFSLGNRLILSSAMAAIFTFGFAQFVYQFLRRFALTNEVSQYQDSSNSIQEQFFEIKRKISSLEERRNVYAQIPSDEKEELARKIFLDAKENLRSGVLEDVGDHFFRGQATAFQDKALRRLSSNLEALGRRANFNLFFGLIVAFMGIAILYYSFFNGVPTLPDADGMIDLSSLLSGYLPKLSMVLIVEVVGFFFLKMYARTLSDIRYVQNEITNIEMKLVALHTSLSLDDEELLKAICLELSATERNFVIEKGQTTIEIETQKASAENYSSALSSAAELVHGPKKKLSSKLGS